MEGDFLRYPRLLGRFHEVGRLKKSVFERGCEDKAGRIVGVVERWAVECVDEMGGCLVLEERVFWEAGRCGWRDEGVPFRRGERAVLDLEGIWSDRVSRQTPRFARDGT